MTQTSTQTIGFIGLGQMGQGMAARLIESGHSLIVYNRSQDKCRALAEAGARVAQRPLETVSRGGIVVSMLADDAAVEAVFDDALLAQIGDGGIHLSMSTLGPATASRLAARHRAHGVAYVACPVFGRPDAARAGKLWLCLAGPTSARARLQPLLDAMGQGVHAFGEDPAAANVTKLAGNFLIASAIEAMGEAYSLAEKHGVDASAVHQLLTQTLFACPIYQNYGKAIVEQRFTPPGFTLRLGAKDMRLVQDAARAAEMPMPLASLLGDRFLRMLATGQGNIDWTGLAADQRQAAGLAGTSGHTA
ncbi:NAD(P)-dependent oxidoreductase [Acidihalobacter prosperus]|uniref:6-phosphogluconate dehydrogenase n=1 Tax=Acidihalobacter prosperus TaxID=160660 RepID=A0A1A6C7J3_9GAMM|nr:NAD(P)-dependent oxidoreductase [Acidihalobacter prosperus]OBS10520.1 6-phosphogluconate dehydrogenase [Acidihalobacter prosperus]